MTRQFPNEDILVVDDETSSLKLLSNILKKAGYTVRLASDGELALRSVKAKLPALILLDIQLPGMDGYEICRHLKDSEDTMDIPVIFISARTNPVDKVKAFGLGAVDYFSKPFESEEVLARVATHLSIWNASKEIEENNLQLQHEIAERKRTEVKLKQAADEWTNTFDSISDLVSIHSRDFKLIRVNRAYANAFSGNPEDFIGKFCFDVCHKTDVCIPDCPHKQTMNTKKSVVVEVFEPCMNKYLEISTSPIFDDSGEFVACVHIAKNITQRKKDAEAFQENERTNRAFVDAIPDMMFYMDKNGTFLDFKNQTNQKTFVSPDEFLGKNVRDVMPLEIAQMTVEYIETVLRTNQIQVFEYNLMINDIENYYEARIVASGKYKVLLIVRDITAHRQAENEIHKLNRELEQRVMERTAELEEKNEELMKMDKVKSEFLDTVSHELRTPLTSIIGYSRLLLDGIQGEMSEKQTNYIERIWSRGMHQLQLVNDVLDFSKLNSGRTSFMMEPVSVAAILADTAEDEMPLAKQKGHELILEVPDEISDVHVDKMRLKQVLTNIINNAIKFTPDNGRIVIKADNADEMVKISIIDNGIGIKEENMGKIFDNFVQVDQSNSRIYGGTGLGLAIARDLVKHMGGRIDAESEYGKGSIFNIFMPQDTPSNISKYLDTLD